MQSTLRGKESAFRPLHCDIGCEYCISYRVGVSYTFYAGSCRLPGIQSPTRTRTGVNGGLRFYF